MLKLRGRNALSSFRLDKLNQALQSAAQLIDIPNAGGCQSTKILPDPERLYRVRRELATAIELLRGEGP